MHLLYILLLDNAAPAQGAEGASGGGLGSMMFFMLGLIAIMYFTMIRPQQKRSKEEKKFRESLSKGDKVMTIGGIHGQVESLDETSALVRVDSNTKLRFEKSALRAVPDNGSDKK